MKDEHKVGDLIKEFCNKESGGFNFNEWLIWRIESIDKKGQYRCICVEDNIDGEQESYVDTYVHFYYKHYKEWVELGSMMDYNKTILPEELFEL